MHLWKEIEQQEDQELFYDEETYKDDFLYSDEHQFGEYEEFFCRSWLNNNVINLFFGLKK